MADDIDIPHHLPRTRIRKRKRSPMFLTVQNPHFSQQVEPALGAALLAWNFLSKDYQQEGI